MPVDAAALNLPALEKQYGLPQGLLSSVMGAESGGNPDALSPAGAIGLFQFMPSTAQQYGIDPTDPLQAAHGAARMFGDLSQKYNGDVPSMLAGYNWGQGNVDRHGLDNAPPETQNYIQKVMAGLGGQQQPQQGDVASALSKIGNFLVPSAKAAEMPQGSQGIALSSSAPAEDRPDTSSNTLPDFSKMSDKQLQELADQTKPQEQKEQSQLPDFSKMSDEQLQALAEQTKPTARKLTAPENKQEKTWKDNSVAQNIGRGLNVAQTAATEGLAAGNPLGLAVNAPAIGVNLGGRILGPPLAYAAAKALDVPMTWDEAVRGSNEATKDLSEYIPTTNTALKYAAKVGEWPLKKLGIMDENSSLLATPGQVSGLTDAQPLPGEELANAAIGMATGSPGLGMSAKSGAVLGTALDAVDQSMPDDSYLKPVAEAMIMGRMNKLAPKIDSVLEDTGKRLGLTSSDNAGGTINPTEPVDKQAPIPTADEMRAGSSGIYKEATELGGVVSPEKTNSFIDEVNKLKPQTAEGAAVVGETPSTKLIERINGLKDKPLTLDAIQEIDEGLSNEIDNHVELGKLKKPGYQIAKIQEKFRQMVDDLQPEDVVGGTDGFDALKDARKTWQQSRKASDIERIVNRAQGMDQPANAIRSGLNSFLNNPARTRGYTDGELAAIKKASETGIVGGLLRVFSSRLVPIGVGAGSIVGSAGLGGIPATAATAGMSYLARRGAQKLQQGRVNQARNVIAQPYNEIIARRKLIAPEAKSQQAAPTVNPAASASEVAAQPEIPFSERPTMQDVPTTASGGGSPLFETARKSPIQPKEQMASLDITPKQAETAPVSADVPKQEAVQPKEPPVVAESKPVEPPQSIFSPQGKTNLATAKMLSAVRRTAIKEGIPENAITVRNGQIKLQNPTHDQANIVQAIINDKQQSSVNRSEAMKSRKLGAPKTFLEEIRRAGGIKPNGEIRAMDLPKTPGLVSENGLTHEQALQLGIEKGWIKNKGQGENPTENSLQDVYDAMENRNSAESTSDEPTYTAYRENLEEEAHKRGVETKGLSDKQVEAELTAYDKRQAELNDFHDALDDEAEVIARQYIPEEERHAIEQIPLSAYEENAEPNLQGNEQFEAQAQNARGGTQAVAVNQKSSGTQQQTGKEGGTKFERVKGVEGEQAVMPGMEQSAKQAMQARGEKITPKVEQKKADEGIFAEPDAKQEELPVTEKSVASSRVEPSVDDIDKATAERAFYNTSHSPEKRGQYYREQYVKDVNDFRQELEKIAKNDDQKAMIDGLVEKYRLGYIDKLNAYLAAHSRVASPMITGPARFPVQSNLKKIATSDKRMAELDEFSKKYAKNAKNEILGARSDEEKSNADWNAFGRDIARDIGVIKAIDDGSKPYNRSAFVNSLAGKIERHAANGDADIVTKALQLVRDQQKGMDKPIFSDRHKVWKSEEIASEKASEVKPEGQEDVQVYDGAAIVNNHDAERVQIHFDEVPSLNLRGKMKSNGWHWSPRDKVWQRKNTPQAINNARSILSDFKPVGFGEVKSRQALKPPTK